MNISRLYKTQLVNAIIFLLTLLWSYAALSKLSDYPAARTSMLAQPLNPQLALILTWLVPVVELSAALLLIFKRTQTAVLAFSWLLMLVFTGYIALVLGNTFGRIPCSCGGLFQLMSWHQHLYFNLFFLVLISVALILKTGRLVLYNPFSIIRKEVPGNRKA